MDGFYPEGATPLDEEEKEGLLLTHITTREELNRWEQDNINSAIEWSFSLKNPDLLSIEFIQKLHSKMFCDVWQWAGIFRTTGKNIGVSPWQISTELKKLLNDAAFWIENTTFPNDEIAARLHQRLTLIHPFPNGNGRHARLHTSLAQKHILNVAPFTWGQADLTQKSKQRRQYIDSLHEADNENFTPLIRFAHS